MATYVLVHGSWGGGWIWGRVRPALEAAGHRVLAPSLTGLGDRHHLAGPGVGLGTHVQDIARLLEWEEIDDAVLVGHSYGGMVVTGVSAVAGARISRVVYVDAFVPRAGQSAFDILSWLREAFVPSDGGPSWAVAPMDFAALGVTDPADLDWLAARATPQSRLTHEEPVGPGVEEALSSIPVTYLHCTGQPHFDDVAADAARRGFRVVALDGCGHMAIVTDPGRLVAELLSPA
ncbi:pimeloyl-ACP methyl ester carboxylesterase [Streptosporangium becharense]|uniref:Pimeloyl-ACP methyl ester carboxylesterase n=1 Tax=Streptosporangium becharense TaxID=1816182 RepID=A0A7W9IJF0_9ACTN|nr:alpha/beta hydrolase [Streptosporangium becharense]MBB2911074.1 pimeloyl-ACP methyl ester carboxylesterase [Streptosporangium becharense]MBB5821868.1 pimeloyl-ACP methyl ester carboxylesterase [Streptosporangium becharense]